MMQFITDNWLLIVVSILLIAGVSAFMHTENPETYRDVRSNSDKITDQLQARKESMARTEADNKAEAEYIKKYFESKDETVLF